MSDGSSYSCDEAEMYAENYINKLYGHINDNFEYRVGIINDCKNRSDKRRKRNIYRCPALLYVYKSETTFLREKHTT